MRSLLCIKVIPYLQIKFLAKEAIQKVTSEKKRIADLETLHIGPNRPEITNFRLVGFHALSQLALPVPPLSTIETFLIQTF